MTRFILYLFGIRQGEAALPPDEYERRDALHPGQDITYLREYGDGCRTRHYGDGSAGHSGKLHAPHEKFHPNDQPVKEWRQE